MQGTPFFKDRQFLNVFLHNYPYLLSLFLGYTGLALLISFSAKLPNLSLLAAKTRYGIFGALRVLINSTMISLAQGIFSADREFHERANNSQHPRHQYCLTIFLIHIFYARFFKSFIL